MAEPAKYAHPATESKAEPVLRGYDLHLPDASPDPPVGPGSCPICGMALEPVLATAETGPSHELVDMTRRFWIGLALSLPVVALEMGGHLTGLRPRPNAAAPRSNGWPTRFRGTSCQR